MQPIEVGQKKARKRKRRKKLFKLLLLVVLLVGAGTAGYYYSDKQAKKDLDSKQAEIAALNDKVSSLEKELEDERTKQQQAEESSNKSPSDKTIESIKAAIESGNMSALRSYMAPEIEVILAASEGMGSRTPSQAVEDLKYIQTAAKPWDFDLPSSTLNSYRNGAYREYFPSDALAGRSADNYVVSFTFDSNGKIDGIFMASDASLLL